MGGEKAEKALRAKQTGTSDVHCDHKAILVLRHSGTRSITIGGIRKDECDF